MEEKSQTKWEGLGLSQETLKLIHEAGYATPTPVQAAAIPPALEGKDLICSAQTGTGKTAAFLLPMIEKIVGRQGTLAVILSPTREIAQQTETAFEMFGSPRGLDSALLIGGINIRGDLGTLHEYPQFIIATPGRLCDHLDRGTVWLDYVETLVLDEADRMLDMGFADQLSRIVQALPNERQTLLFSATIPKAVENLARQIMREPKRILVGLDMKASASVQQKFIWMRPEDKNRELLKLVQSIPGSILIFTRTKLSTNQVWRMLYRSGFADAAYLSSSLEQSVREQVLSDFRSGKIRILVATDVASRGIHVENIEHVINYDPPGEADEYVHRVGRTGRAGTTGSATTFLTSLNRRIFREIEKLSGHTAPVEFAEGFRHVDMRDQRPRSARRSGRSQKHCSRHRRRPSSSHIHR